MCERPIAKQARKRNGEIKREREREKERTTLKQEQTERETNPTDIRIQKFKAEALSFKQILFK